MSQQELLALVIVAAMCAALMAGFPVAFTLGGVSLICAGLGLLTGSFDPSFLETLPNRIYGIMSNEVLMAVPLFVFMGIMLERSRISENLLDTMAQLFGPVRGGLGISVAMVGMLLAASTGIVGATVVTMGLLSLPAMVKRGYDPSLACGTICAAGTLGQIIPPSVILVMLGDVLGSAYQQAQLSLGVYNPKTVSVGDLFVGALIPGLLLVVAYICYIAVIAWLRPAVAPAIPEEERRGISRGELLRRVIQSLLPPFFLILAVLGSIIGGVATPTEAAAVGALGAMLLALRERALTWRRLREVVVGTLEMSTMVFLILIGAAMFSLVFRGFGGDEAVHELLSSLPGGALGAMVVVMVVMFLLGFVLDFIEIIFVMVPLVGPALMKMGLDPLWLGIMMAINLQTSFLTPPFGFSLFYLRGVAPPSITTEMIYRGVMPFIVLQLIVLILLACWPSLVTWLPSVVYSD